MDRINGADTVDIGGGRRGFIDEDLGVGQVGTEVTALWLNMTQEEIVKVIEASGLVLNAADWTQLWQALQILGLSAGARSRRWTSVISMTLSSAPGAPSAGDTYLIPTGATGIWAAEVGKIAEWSGTAWSYFTPADGHGVGLPTGRLFLRIGGAYEELLATTVRAGLTRLATLAETLLGLISDKAVTPEGLSYTLATRQLGLRNTVSFDVAGSFTWVVPPNVNRALVRVIGGGGSGGPVNAGYRHGGGGGGGGIAEGWVNLTPGDTVNLIVGAGGVPYTAGGSSSFGSLLSATGGTAGGVGAPGLSGVGSGGLVNSGLGDGGGGAQTSDAYASGNGGGPGGSVGRAGRGPGGGGGGAYDSGGAGSVSGGNGAAGQIVIMY